jgi:hypothetical protein
MEKHVEERRRWRWGELGDGVAERVQEADGPCDRVEEDEEAIDGAQAAVGGERREVDAEGCRGGHVEEASARPGVGADGKHHPVAGPEAAVQAPRPAPRSAVWSRHGLHAARTQ